MTPPKDVDRSYAATRYDKAPRRALSRCDGRRDVSAFPLRRNLAVKGAMRPLHPGLEVPAACVVAGARAGLGVAVDERRDVAVAVVVMPGSAVASGGGVHLEPPVLGTLT